MASLKSGIPEDCLRGPPWGALPEHKAPCQTLDTHDSHYWNGSRRWFWEPAPFTDEEPFAQQNEVTGPKEVHRVLNPHLQTP